MTDERPLVSALYQCAGCERASLFVFQTFIVMNERVADLMETFPAARGRKKELLPDDVQRDWLEAMNCLLDAQYRAATLMARSALQRAVRGLHTFRGSLNQELDNLVKEGLITKQLRANADEVRLTGNDVAHPEDLGTISKSDAHDSLVFLSDFLETSVVVPERQRRRADARAALPPDE
jgi:hypothetical protein